MEPEPIIFFPARKQQAQRRVHFSKQELSRILAVYGRMVTAGIWRDYAIDYAGDDTGDDAGYNSGKAGGAAVAFSVFRRASETPAYRIIKEPGLAKRQGAYAVVGRQGQILKRGKTIENILSIFDRKMLHLVK